MKPPIFQVEGLIAERRELTSAKNATWRGYILKVATIGSTLEMNCTAEQFNSVADGDGVACQGKIEDQAGRMRLTLIVMKKTGEKAA